MSQIMEALRQAQAQRSGAAASADAPPEPAEPQLGPATGPSRVWPWILAAALAGGVAAWAWFEFGPGLTVTAKYLSPGHPHIA
jgi:hypothetical protein